MKVIRRVAFGATSSAPTTYHANLDADNNAAYNKTPNKCVFLFISCHINNSGTYGIAIISVDSAHFNGNDYRNCRIEKLCGDFSKTTFTPTGWCTFDITATAAMAGLIIRVGRFDN